MKNLIKKTTCYILLIFNAGNIICMEIGIQCHKNIDNNIIEKNIINIPLLCSSASIINKDKSKHNECICCICYRSFLHKQDHPYSEKTLSIKENDTRDNKVEKINNIIEESFTQNGNYQQCINIFPTIISCQSYEGSASFAKALIQKKEKYKINLCSCFMAGLNCDCLSLNARIDKECEINTKTCFFCNNDKKSFVKGFFTFIKEQLIEKNNQRNFMRMPELNNENIIE